MIRQVLGRAELRVVKDEQSAQKADLVGLLSDTIIQLLPRTHDANSQPYDVRGMIVDIVEKCINLANIMTAEQAFYKCTMVCAGELPSEASVRAEQSGRVFMCTFPGLVRNIYSDGEIAVVSLVKPSVELESMIRPIDHSGD